jgi:hypothetical protein
MIMSKKYIVRLWLDVEIKADTKEEAIRIGNVIRILSPEADIYEIQIDKSQIREIEKD